MNGSEHMDSEGYDGILTVLSASPLVVVNENGEFEPLDTFAVDREHHQLNLDKASLNIRIDEEVCSRQRFRMFLKQKLCRILHFAVHATEDHLFFEADKGQADLIPISEFVEWLECVPLELVVVADCQAEIVVEAFLQSSIPHIIVCPVDKYKLDEAAVVFCNVFYQALASNQTVKDAFEDGRKAVLHSEHLNYTDGRQEVEKYQLLPEDAAHDVVIYNRQSSRNKIPHIPQQSSRLLPMPPPIFVGRQKEIRQLIKDLESTRLIRMSGNNGGSCFVKSACQFMVNRRDEFPHDIIWFPPRLGPRDDLSILFTRILEAFGNLTDPDRDDLVRLVDILKQSQVILVCDSRGWDSRESVDELMDFLDEIFDVTSGTRAIIIYPGQVERTLQFSSNYQEKSVELKPLGYSSTVTLFGLLCPHVSKKIVPSITSVCELKKLLVPAAGYVGSDNLKMTIVKIYNLLGHGTPVRIRDLAVSMTEEEYSNLIQVGKLREKLSRLYQKQVEMAFPTRFSLEYHLKEISEVIDEAKKEKRKDDVMILEAKYLEVAQRRKELPSIETMLVKRKALKTEQRFAKLSGRHSDAELGSADIAKIEKAIAKEREAMTAAGEDWFRLSYVEYPRGISRRTLENRYTAKEHLFFDARKTEDGHTSRELEFPLKELNECRNMLPSVLEWNKRLKELEIELRDTELTTDDADKLVHLIDQTQEIKARIEEEEGAVDAAHIADDLCLSLDAFLRYTGDSSVQGLPEFEALKSRKEANDCLEKIVEISEVSTDDFELERYNTHIGLYKELCVLIQNKFPSIESLLLERQGLLLEQNLVHTDDEEVVGAYRTEIESIEQHVSAERKALGLDPLYGVTKEFYLNGITRVLVDKRLERLQAELEEANDEENILLVAELEMKLAELTSHRDRLPTASEITMLIERTKQDLKALAGRVDEASNRKRILMEVAVVDLQRRLHAEKNPKERSKTDIATELMINEKDYFFPPAMNDDSSERQNAKPGAMSDDEEDGGELSTVNEASEEDDE